MSNIQVLVHLFLSKSLLIVIDEFQRIVCIVSNIFFIIIQLLYTVACVVVSNLLPLFPESNTSNYHFAMASYLTMTIV